MRRGEVWFANVPGGDRPVLDRSEFRRLITTVAPHRMEQICVTLNAALGC